MIAPTTILVPIKETMAAQFTLIVIIYLAALAVAQALSTTVGKRSKLQRLGRYLNIGMIPLLFVFLLRMTLEVVKVVEAFR
jgi:hypothetical protein